MKAVIAAVVLAMAVFCSPAAKAWDCTQPGQIRVQVPSGTVGTGTGDGPGQVVTVEGITFQCQTPPTPPTTPSNPGSTSASTSNSSSNSTSGASSSSTANGGNATAAGGNQKQGQQQTATGGSVSGSGNSTNSNTSTSSASNNGNGANNSTYSNVTDVAASKIPVASSAPVTILPANPCFKGFGGGIQTMAFGGSFGGGKIDGNCAILEASRLAPNIIARCKVYISNKYVKAAGVTLEDCLTQPETVAPPIAVTETPASAPIVIPAPQITVNIPAPIVQTPPAVSPIIPVKPATAHNTVRWIPYNGKYEGQKLVIVGPFEGICDAADALVKTGVPRANISVRSSDRDSKVRIYVVTQ